MTPRARNHWGWGWEDEAPSHEQLREAAGGLAQHLGFGSPEPERPVAAGGVELPRAAPRAAGRRCAEICATTPTTSACATPTGAPTATSCAVPRPLRRIRPTWSRARATRRDVEPCSTWAGGRGAAVIPFGGGTSVVGGVEPRVGDGYAGAVSLDLAALDRVLEVDAVSRAARIQAGALGPDLEAQLAPHGLTLRHFPQSFELSTLGGWIATRAGGHFATG